MITFVRLLTIDWNLTLFAPISDRISEIIAKALSILAIAFDELCSEDKSISLREIKLEDTAEVDALKWLSACSDVTEKALLLERVICPKIAAESLEFESPTKLKTYANIYIKNKMDYYKLDIKIPKFAKLNK